MEATLIHHNELANRIDPDDLPEKVDSIAHSFMVFTLFKNMVGVRKTIWLYKKYNVYTLKLVFTELAFNFPRPLRKLNIGALNDMCIMAEFIDACGSNDLAKVTQLYETRVININRCFLNGPPIQHAMLNGAGDVVKYLLDLGCNIHSASIETIEDILLDRDISDDIREMIVGKFWVGDMRRGHA
jgi:hypothetical protein